MKQITINIFVLLPKYNEIIYKYNMYCIEYFMCISRLYWQQYHPFQLIIKQFNVVSHTHVKIYIYTF